MKNAVAVLLLFVSYWAVAAGIVLALLGFDWWRYSFAVAVSAVAVSLVLMDRNTEPPGS